MVLHELSHAYYHSALEWRWEEVGAAYKQAMSSGLYESVPHINGDLHKAYAALNQEEYFAELSEAYFGKNDFFPFTRDELKKYDPVGFQLMQDTWRSEEHTSELQSLMRISYAVFCLKKKNKHTYT